MNLTLTQAKERADCLSGEIKAAITALTECELAEADQERLASIARQATANAHTNLANLRAERDTLADHAAALIRQKGEPLPVETPASDHPGAIAGEPPPEGMGIDTDTPYPNGQGPYSALMARTEERMNEAFDRGRNP